MVYPHRQAMPSSCATGTAMSSALVRLSALQRAANLSLAMTATRPVVASLVLGAAVPSAFGHRRTSCRLPASMRLPARHPPPTIHSLSTPSMSLP